MSVEEIAKTGLVEEIVRNVGKGELQHDLQDLTQDIYLQLLTKDKDRIERMTPKEVRYYISRIVCNSILSKTSRYYYTYKKNRKTEIPDNGEEMAQDTD